MGISVAGWKINIPNHPASQRKKKKKTPLSANFVNKEPSYCQNTPGFLWKFLKICKKCPIIPQGMWHLDMTPTIRGIFGVIALENFWFQPVFISELRITANIFIMVR